MKLRRFALPVCLALTAALAITGSAVGSATAQSAAASTIVTGHTGSGTPALAEVGPRLYVAWTGSSGTPAARSLTFGYSTTKGRNIVKVATGEKIRQDEGPALLSDPHAPGVVMAWADASRNDTLTVVYYNGSALRCRTSFGFVSHHTPALAYNPSTDRTYMAWTDENRQLNIAELMPDTCATSPTHTIQMGFRAQFQETSPYGPGLAFNASWQHELANGMVLSWVIDGAPGARNIDLASWYDRSTTMYRYVAVTKDVDPVSGPTIASIQGPPIPTGDNIRMDLAFRGNDNFAYLADGLDWTGHQAHNTNLQVSSGVGIEAHGHYYGYFNPTGHLVIRDSI